MLEDLEGLALPRDRPNKRAEHRLNLAEGEGDYEGLKSISDVGSGKPHDPEKKRLSEIIEALNDLFGAEVSDRDKLHFANGVADCIRRDQAVMAQVNNHRPDQVMHGLLPRRVTDTVLDAMTDHEKLTMQVLDGPEKSREFARLILRLLVGLSAGDADSDWTESGREGH